MTADRFGTDAVLVSYGEVGTKSRQVRVRMTRRLRNNVAALLADRDVPAEVEQRWARLVVHTDHPERAAGVAADAMGVVWARPVVTVDADVAAVNDALDRLAREGDPHDAADTFAVRARRVGDDATHDFSSHDLEVAGGRAVEEATGAAVDLDDPDRTYHVEVRDDRAYVARETVEGPGGLPLGTQSSLVALVSGGHDSPVAAYEVMRRGSPVVPVYVGLGVYGGPDHEARAVSTIRRLQRFAPNFDLRPRVVPGGDVAERLAAEVDETRMLSWRRALLRIGAEVADREGARGVVTGEALGQKSSQTAGNLAVTDAAVDCSVHRPLLTRDKADIVALARDIGTDEDASIPVGCERLAPEYPETNATLSGVRAAEPDDVLDRAAAAVDRMRVVEN